MSQSRQHKNFDQPVHNLRAIAIILVVYAHCAAFLPDSRILYITPDEKNLYGNIFRLFSGGTYIFAFISGYLSYALFRNTPYIEFIVKKIKHILFPYLFFSLSLLTVSYAKLRFFGVHWHAVRQFDSWNAVAKALLTGGVQGHYWYMPFIFCCFLLTPLILRLKKNVLYSVVLVLIFVPLLIYPKFVKSDLVITFCTCFANYFPSFMFGIVISAYRNESIDLFHKHIFILLCISAASSFISIYLTVTNLYGSWTYLLIGAYVSKMPLCVALLALFNRFNFKCRLIDLIAQNSFTIYFIHCVVAHVFFHKIFNIITSMGASSCNIVFAFMLSSLIVVLLSLVGSMAMRAVLKSKARCVIG